MFPKAFQIDAVVFSLVVGSWLLVIIGGSPALARGLGGGLGLGNWLNLSAN